MKCSCGRIMILVSKVIVDGKVIKRSFRCSKCDAVATIHDKNIDNWLERKQ